jgi:hypothetical protein
MPLPQCLGTKAKTETAYMIEAGFADEALVLLRDKLVESRGWRLRLTERTIISMDPALNW